MDPITNVEVEPGSGSEPGRNYLQIIWKRKSLAILGLALGLVLGLVNHSRKPSVYQSASPVLVVKKAANHLPVAGGDPRVTLIDDYMATHLVLLRSPLILERAVKKRELGALKSFENAGDPVAVLQTNLTVTRDQQAAVGSSTNIIHLSFRGPVAEDCGQVLSAVIDSYQEFLDVTFRNVSEQTLELITKARDVIKKDLSGSEQRYLTFVQKSPQYWRNKDGTNVEHARVASLEGRRSELLMRQTELAEKIRIYEKAIAAGKGSSLARLIAPASAGDGKSAVVGGRPEDELLPVLLKEQELLEDYGPDHPQVRAIRKRLEFFKAHLKQDAVTEAKDGAGWLLEALRVESDETDAVLRSLTTLLEKIKVEAQSLTNVELEENHLRNEIKRLELLYDGTIKRLQEINLVRESGGFDAQPLSRPGVGVRVGPSPIQDVVPLILLGLVVGAGLAYLVDAADKSFRNPDEIRRQLGLPLVGHIPSFEPDPAAQQRHDAGAPTLDPLLCTHMRPKSLEAEAYRALRTALFFSMHASERRVIQVTSPNRGDGKSLTIANLAVSVAQSGRSVLLIDADCRRPRQHRIFSLDNATGLASILSHETSLHEAIRSTAVPGLSVLTSGPIPHHPSELLISQQFTELLDVCAKEFDYVLVDTPPLLAVTDPCVVASRVEGLYLVIRLTRQGRPEAKRAREILGALGVNVLGVVVNGVSRGNSGVYSSYSYDYSYSYQDYYDTTDDDQAPDYEGDDAAPRAAVASPTEPPTANGHGAKGLFSRWWNA